MSNENKSDDAGLVCSCGAECVSSENRCWLCGERLTKSHTAEKAPQDSGGTFRLNSLMLTITLIAVCLGVFRISIGLGFLLTILVTPAFLRTAVAATRGRRKGEPLTTEGKFAMFAASFGLVVAISIASGVACFATCWMGFFAGMSAGEAAGAVNEGLLGYGVMTGLIAGLSCGLIVAVLLFWKLFRLRKSHRGDVSRA